MNNMVEGLLVISQMILSSEGLVAIETSKRSFVGVCSHVDLQVVRFAETSLTVATHVILFGPTIILRYMKESTTQAKELVCRLTALGLKIIFNLISNEIILMIIYRL